MSSSKTPAAKPSDQKAEHGNSSSTSKETDKQQQPAAVLEEDDEFEDFPIEDWGPEDTEVASGNAHLWEESWDDDDTNEDFSKQLKEELEKVKAGGRDK